MKAEVGQERFIEKQCHLNHFIFDRYNFNYIF